MKITPSGSVPTKRAPASYFTGTVWQDPVIETPAPARLNATHPLGQTLYVLAGCGCVQTEGEPVREIRPGDVVWIPPGEKHWHGAAPTTMMTHLAMQESDDSGSFATWLEHVTDAQYAGQPAK
jgi:hypothetical protein